MKKLIIERTFNTSREHLWDAFTTAEHLKQWWSPKSFDCSHAQLELKPNGLFLFCFKGKDGTEFWGRGIYQTIDAPHTISYLDCFSDKDGNAVPPEKYGMPGKDIQEALVEFKFSTVTSGTLMTATMDDLNEDPMTEQMTQGWSEMFDKLDKLLMK